MPYTAYFVTECAKRLASIRAKPQDLSQYYNHTETDNKYYPPNFRWEKDLQTNNNNFNPCAAINFHEDIVVLNTTDSNLSVFTKKGQVIKVGSPGSGDGQLKNPKAFNVIYQSNSFNNKSNIVVADTGNHRIQFFSTLDGTFVSSFGSKGSGDGEFESPSGITVDQTNGNIIVSDTGNNRIQIFSSDGKFISKFGTKGSNNEQLNGPTGIFKSQGNKIYVIDTGNCCIKSFTPNGTFVKKYGGLGNDFGQFQTPLGIQVTSTEKVVVVDGNSIQKFEQDGKCIWKYKGNMKPSFVKICRDGFMIITDNSRKVVSYYRNI